MSMARSEKPTRPWQVRLAPEEDEAAARLAEERMISKNDVVRRALSLMLRLEKETRAGGRLLLERPGTGERVEVWLL